MKLYKLGLLALTASLVATIIILDKKNNKDCGCENNCDLDESTQEEFSDNNVVVEECEL